MTTFQVPIVAGVFQEEAQAKKALEDLMSANFARDQLGVATHGKDMAENLAGEFLKLGVSQDRANYYEQEFRAGHVIVSVRPDGRDEEARSILHNDGAYDYDSGSMSTQAPRQQWTGQGQPTNDAMTGNYGQNDYRQGEGDRQDM